VTLQKIGVEFLRSEREVVPLIKPFFGVQAKGHPARARIDPRASAEVGFDGCEAGKSVGFEGVHACRVHATLDAIDDLPPS
jgi:hypothetical protein